MIDLYVGGVVCEVKYDGFKDIWGEVLVYDDLYLFVMMWYLGMNEDYLIEVCVEFEVVGFDCCKVILIYKGWEIWVEKVVEMCENYNGGWVGLLD